MLMKKGVISNQELSQKRAESVMEFLISQGVKKDHVFAVGYGDSEPIAPNTTPQGRAQNRRVELTLGGSAN
jgi:chemotaxis protein MotB